MNTELQRRYLDAPIQTTSGSAGTTAKRITGYAAVFNQETELSSDLHERIDRGAFVEAIGRDDVRALINHDFNLVLGRIAAGTLTLREDERGLYYEISPPDTTFAKDLITSIRRGDISGSSFGFSILDKAMTQAKGYILRTIKKVKLFDISVVTFPAYPQTEGITARYTMSPQGASDDSLWREFDELKKIVARGRIPTVAELDREYRRLKLDSLKFTIARQNERLRRIGLL